MSRQTLQCSKMSLLICFALLGVLGGVCARPVEPAGAPPVPGLPAGGQVPPVPGVPAGGQVPPVPGVPAGGQVPPVPGVPAAGQVPPVPGVPAGGQVPSVPGVPAGGQVPSVPGVPAGGQVPSVPNPQASLPQTPAQPASSTDDLSKQLGENAQLLGQGVSQVVGGLNPTLTGLVELAGTGANLVFSSLAQG